MFNERGQPELFHRTAYGSGKGGGGSNVTPGLPPLQTLVDPVSGMAFTDDPYTFSNDPLVPPAPRRTAAEQLNEEIIGRKAKEADTAAQQKAADETAAQQKETDFQTQRDNEYNSALQRIMKQFSDQGLDPNKYLESDIRPELDRVKGTIQDLDPNPGAAFTADLGQNILDNLTSGVRGQAKHTLDQTFSPDYALKALPDTLLGPISDQILKGQLDPFTPQLTAARNRGTLTPTGYNAALAALANAKSTGAEKLQKIGSGILASDRGDLNDLISGAGKTAGSLGLGDTFDPSTYVSSAQSKIDTDKLNLGGAIRDQLGGATFTDLQQLLNAGGAAQGATNPNATNPTALGGGIPTDPNAVQKRGLGSAGAF